MYVCFYLCIYMYIYIYKVFISFVFVFFGGGEYRHMTHVGLLSLGFTEFYPLQPSIGKNEICGSVDTGGRQNWSRNDHCSPKIALTCLFLWLNPCFCRKPK